MSKEYINIFGKDQYYQYDVARFQLFKLKAKAEMWRIQILSFNMKQLWTYWFQHNWDTFTLIYHSIYKKLQKTKS